MKQKIIYCLLIVILLCTIYFGLRFKFGLFTPYNFWTAKQDIRNRKIKIIEIGELPLNFNLKQKLANSYGFYFYLYGCNVTTDILNGTEYYNGVMVSYLEKKYGKGWWTKFKTQLDSIDIRTIRQISKDDFLGSDIQ